MGKKMPLIDLLKKELERCEGKRNTVYDDATGLPITKDYCLRGNPTIGIGRCLSSNPLTEDEIQYLLNGDCRNVIIFCTKTFEWFSLISEVRQAAICNMVFQLGENGFLKFKNFITLMANQDFKAAVVEAKKSAWYNQTQLRADHVLYMIEYDRQNYGEA